MYLTPPATATDEPTTAFVLDTDPAAIGDWAYRSELLASYDEAASTLEASLALRRELSQQAARMTTQLQPTSALDWPIYRDPPPNSKYDAPLRPPQVAFRTLLELIATQADMLDVLSARNVLVSQIERLDITIETAALAELRLRDQAATALRFEKQKAEAESYVLSIALEDNAQREAALEAAATRSVTTSRYYPTLTDTSYGVVRWTPLVQKYFPQRLWKDALAVMWCESRGDPNAASPVSDARGLFQHKLKYWPPRAVGAGFPGASVFDPEANVAAAAQLVSASERQGKPTWIYWACKP